MNYQVELDQIRARRADLDREEQSIIDSVVAHSKCRGCHWMSNPKQGVVPTCRNIDNANYARRVPHVTFCRQHQALQARRAKAAAP